MVWTQCYAIWKGMTFENCKVGGCLVGEVAEYLLGGILCVIIPKSKIPDMDQHLLRVLSVLWGCHSSYKALEAGSIRVFIYR